MSAPVISVEGIGKAYRIGTANPTHTNFGEHLIELLKTPLKRLRMKSEDWSDAEDTYWAIRNIDFKVYQGEVCGITTTSARPYVRTRRSGSTYPRTSTLP